MATSVAEAAGDERPSSTTNRAPRPVRRERPAVEGEGSMVARFFLAKAGSNGNTPALDRELASEGEAMIESLKSGLSYYCVAEYRAVADYSGKNPQVKKEAVKG